VIWASLLACIPEENGGGVPAAAAAAE